MQAKLGLHACQAIIVITNQSHHHPDCPEPIALLHTGQLTQSMKPGSKWKVVTSKLGQQGNPNNLANFLKALDNPPQLQFDVNSSTDGK